MYDNMNAPLTMGANVPYQPQVSYGYAAPVSGYCPGWNSFAIIVVLFILLIIIGACAFSGYKG